MIYRLRRLTLIGVLLFLSLQLSANETDSTSRLSWFDRVDEWYTANMNYGTITALMAAESSIFPVPSELVVPPAAFIASRGDVGMKMIWVIVFATIGAWIGATINYFVLGMWLGRNIIYKFADSRLGRMLLLSSEKLKQIGNIHIQHIGYLSQRNVCCYYNFHPCNQALYIYSGRFLEDELFCFLRIYIAGSRSLELYFGFSRTSRKRATRGHISLLTRNRLRTFSDSMPRNSFFYDKIFRREK